MKLLRDEEGVVSMFVSIAFIGIVAILGLLADGAAIRSGRRQLGDLASQAARVAAQEVSLEELKTTGQLRLNPTRARQQALKIISKSPTPGISASVEVEGRNVTVSINRRINLWGNRNIQISATHLAQAVSNLNTASDP